MKFYPVFLLIWICICIGSCNLPTKSKKKKSFRVDVSLDSSNKADDGKFEFMYGMTTSILDENDSRRTLIDSIFKTTKDAINFLDSLKMVLNEKDSTGERTDVSNDLFVNTETSKILLQKLTAVQTATMPILVFETSANQVAIDLSDDLTTPVHTSWDTVYFYKTPTFAAITMLNKFQNDCYKAGFYVMKNIYRTTDNE